MLLGLDTTTEQLHLALVEEDRAWTKTVSVGIGRSHSAALMPSLQALMAEADRTTTALKGVVCCVGPGGFTALRIGVATAEGLALTSLLTWGFSAFELRARALHRAGHAGPFWILLDGQRHEAFVQPWTDEPLQAAHKVPIPALPELLGNQPWWAPEGFRPRVSMHLDTPPLVLENQSQAALDALVELCRERCTQPPESPLVPFYLRETDAELNFPEASIHLPDELRRGIAR